MKARTATLVSSDGLIEIIAGLPTAPADEPDQLQFLAEHWPSLAAAAYEGFRRFGIGAVVVDTSEPPPDEQQVVVTWRLGYAPGHSEWVYDRLPAGTARWLDEQFQTYDPSTAALFLFAEGDGPLRPYAARSPFTPRDAFGRSRVPLN